MASLSSPWLIAFVIVAITHLILLGLDVSRGTTLTKSLLAPLLAAWVIQQDGPWLLVVALIGCFFGDLFLEFENDLWFLAGMGAFAIGHVFFVTYFVQHDALDGLSTHWWILPLLAVAAIGLVVWVWNGLDPGLRIPIPVYAILLSATAAVALVSDARAGIGALLFLFSDAVIALRIAEVIDANSTIVRLTVMVTYIAAIFLLTVGIVDFHERDAPSNSETAPPTLPTSLRSAT